MLDTELEKRISDAEMLTRDRGQIAVSEAQKRQVALYSNGLALIVGSYRWNAEYKVLANQAEKKGYPIKETVEVEISTLEELYRKHSSLADPIGGELELERQAALAELLRKAAAESASDIHIRVVRGYCEIRTRVYGRMKDLDTCKAEEGMAMILAAFSVASDMGTTSSSLSFMQGALTPTKSQLLPRRVEMVRLQYSPTSENRGALVMRLKYESPANEIEIDHLGYNDQQISDISTMRRRTNGLYILSGKVSSGKSTTLQRVLNKMNIEKKREITTYTIEEPVELDLPGAIQVPVKKNPDGTDGFALAMKSSLRSDPNIIVLGEIRTPELASLGIQAVMTGHALWSTVHAGTALGILDRLIDIGVEPWKLAEPTVVRGLVYQRLTGTICPHCRVNLRKGVEGGALEESLAKRLCRLFAKKPEELYVRGPGCPECKMGLAGRTVVAETILTDATLLTLFSQGKRDAMRKYWLAPKDKGGLGGIPVLHHALTKVGAGICDINEVEEEVDLLEVFEKQFPFLRPRLLQDVAELEARMKG